MRAPGASPARRRDVAIAGVVALIALVVAAIVGPSFLRIGTVGPLTNAEDFRAFYCAGRVFREGHDPYRIEPLRACEDAAARDMGLYQQDGMVNAAPQPPYAIAAFAVVSFLPFRAATCVWQMALLLSVIGTVLALVRMTKFPSIVIAAIVGCGSILGMLSGEIGPLVVFAIVVAALASASGRWNIAIAALAVASLVPHVALPCCAALAIFRPSARRPLLILTFLFALVSVVTFGAATCIEYAFMVLPAHARSETHAIMPQYSLTTLAALAGVPDHAARLLGQIDYAAMMLLGGFVGGRLAERFGREEFLILVGPAFIALGGPFIHLYQLAVVFPAAMLFASVTDGISRRWASVAVCGILVSMFLDLAWGTSLFAPLGHGFRSQVEMLRPTDFASDAMRLWHLAQVTTDETKIRSIVAIKMPAFVGMIGFVCIAIRVAVREKFDDTGKIYIARNIV